METTDNLQYIFACLATHSYVVSRVRSEFDEIHRYFKLSSQDEASLRLFMNTQGVRLLTSAILMEDKRWREMLPAIRYVTALVSKDDLRSYWVEYLASIKAVENIPESTISEAINFLNYILPKYNDVSILREIIQYEIAKNLVSVFDFSTISDRIIYPVDHIKDHYDSYRVALNPSYSIVNFNFPISKIINDLTKGNTMDMNGYSCINKNEHIVFVKSRVSKVVRTVSLNHIGHHLLDALINLTSLGCWKKSIGSAFQSQEDVCHKFIKTMIDIDLVTIEKMGGP